ncbi:ankyrin repeat and BTB/POZ domain-containing protein 1 isoform X3 [Myotis lucifugus]|uniref:ankyrin repeat and BTB/POZ domain-containing protein 1 isoform X3 n=1 Tax=Myotis lucifugus TaxID=59463 RepID=UPI000CCC253E|nr:ankyrin repeat and BTB/POZ domain-containing protein 1 isoform X3 [Myotis lucifugus]XP_059562760.1 ankyrin repeat and BTB/POZ domain-containing protein 1 isoform X6 [Myotis daubentonii]
MDISDLFTSCRKGDVGRVRYLLEQRDVDVNVWDKWDSTPLYYACLCGHEELVLYLLANGARCEANTFHGERCFYGAASDTIRRALLDYKQVTPSSRRRDYYDEFLQRLLDQGIHSDVLFVVHGKPFRAHRCILGARSSYFANMLDTKWKGKSIVVLRHPLINAVAFGALLQYLYTGGLDVGVEHISDCERLAKQCQLLDLLNDLEAKCKEVSEFVASKPGTHVKVLSMRPPAEDPRLREDLALLADCALPPELRVPPEVAYDVLSMADMYLLPGLKRLCGRSLAQLLDEDSVVGLWRVAKLFRLARLEDQCTEYMAKVIEKLVEQEDFSEAVREEAAAVRGRQEQDSIPLVDDIRFHITSVVQTYSNIKEMERRLHALEDLLVSIGLDC